MPRHQPPEVTAAAFRRIGLGELGQLEESARDLEQNDGHEQRRAHLAHAPPQGGATRRRRGLAPHDPVQRNEEHQPKRLMPIASGIKKRKKDAEAEKRHPGGDQCSGPAHQPERASDHQHRGQEVERKGPGLILAGQRLEQIAEEPVSGHFAERGRGQQQGLCHRGSGATFRPRDLCRVVEWRIDGRDAQRRAQGREGRVQREVAPRARWRGGRCQARSSIQKSANAPASSTACALEFASASRSKPSTMPRSRYRL